MGETASGTRRRLAVAAATAVVALACGETSATPTTSQPAPTSPIRIGVIDDSGASTAVEAAELRVDTDLAVDEINRSGGIDGRPVRAIYRDAQGDASKAVGVAQQLVQQDGADVLVGGISSPECLGIQNLAPRLQTVYLASTGCPSEDFTGRQCNAYSFRVSPAGRQTAFPLSRYLVRTYGPKWALVYSNDADGQAQAATYGAGLQRAGGALAQQIAIPPNATNVRPYLAKIPTNGSIAGVIDARGQGMYPVVVNGNLVVTNALSDSPQDNQYDLAYHAAFRRQLASEDPSVLSALGPAATAVPGTGGYQAYATISALKLGMIASGFARRADARKLVTALENLQAAPGADFPAGAFAMRKSDHQGTMTTYIVKITGQTEDVVATLAPNSLPAIGDCQAK